MPDFPIVDSHVYRGCTKFDQPPGYREVPFNVSHPKMFSAWHRLAPRSQHWSPRLLHCIWKPKEIYVTGSGCTASDAVASDGRCISETA